MVFSLTLPLAELDLLNFQSLAFTAHDCLSAAFTLTYWLLKVLSLFDRSHIAALLYLAAEPAKQVLQRFFRVFPCNLYHRHLIIKYFFPFGNREQLELTAGTALISPLAF